MQHITGHRSLATCQLESSGSQSRFYGIKLLERCPLRHSVLQEQGQIVYGIWRSNVDGHGRS